MPFRKYWLKLAPVLRTATFRQSIVTTGSIVANGVLAAIFYLAAAKVLGPDDYGLFSLSAATVAIMSVVFDFGNDKGMVRFVSKYGHDSREGARVMKAVFLTKLASGMFFTLLFTVFAAPLARALYNQPEMARLMPLTALAFFTQLMLFFVTYYFQAAEKFMIWGFLFVNANLIRLILLFVVFAFGRLNAVTALGLFALTPFISFIIGLGWMGLDFMKSRLDRSVFTEIYSYNKWAFGFSAVSTVSSRLDTFLTSQLSTLQNVGVYGLANQATYIMPNLVSALGAVTSPKFARFRDHRENKRYLFKSSLFFFTIAMVCAVILIPLGYVFMRFSGPVYLSGFTPFILLIAAQVIFLALTPVRDSLLYYYSRPDFFFWVSLAHGAVTLASGVFLIPRIGLLGAAVSNLSGQLLLNSLSLWMYLRLQAHN